MIRYAAKHPSKQSSIYLQIRLMRWLPLCPLLHSSKPQRFPPSLCNYGLKRPSVGTRERGIIFQKDSKITYLFGETPLIKRELKGCSNFLDVRVTYTLSLLVSSYLCIPDVHAFVKGTTCQMPTIRAESHTVDWLLVLSQRMDTDASIHVPKTNCGIKRCTVEVGDRDTQGYGGAAVESGHTANNRVT